MPAFAPVERPPEPLPLGLFAAELVAELAGFAVPVAVPEPLVLLALEALVPVEDLEVVVLMTSTTIIEKWKYCRERGHSTFENGLPLNCI